MSMLHTPRMMSNKENSLSSPAARSHLPSFISKPTLGGLGRSPRKKGGHHSAKPYARAPSASIYKAKSTSIKGVYSSIRNEGKVGKKVPPPLKLATSSHSSATSNGEVAGRVPSEVKIPLSLPTVNIPLVPHLDEHFDPKIPFEYVRSRLLPRLSAFGIVSARYQAYPALDRPPHLSDPGASARHYVAFGVASIMAGQDPNGVMAGKMKGREPDLCLAITRKGQDPSLKTPASLVPVNTLIFASQCAYWSRVTAIPEASPRPESVPSPELQSIKEEPDSGSETETDEPEEEEVTSRSPRSPASSSTIVPSPASSPKTESLSPRHEEQPPQYPESILQLPLQDLPLPSPETYSYLHNLLHFTHSPAPSTFSPMSNLLGMDVSGLHKLDNRELMKKLGVIQGVWKNCCFLGVGDAKIWQGMRDAWGAAAGILAERSKRVQAMDVDQ